MKLSSQPSLGHPRTKSESQPQLSSSGRREIKPMLYPLQSPHMDYKIWTQKAEESSGCRGQHEQGRTALQLGDSPKSTLTHLLGEPLAGRAGPTAIREGDPIGNINDYPMPYDQRCSDTASALPCLFCSFSEYCRCW